MTEFEFDQFRTKFVSRWRWFKADDAELTAKLWDLFARFPYQPACDALHQYDTAEPDLSFKNFKHRRLLDLMLEAQDAAEPQFGWYPCDEAQYGIECWNATLRHLPEPDIATFATDSLRKCRAPTDGERQAATEKLKAMGALPANEVYSRQRQDWDAYRRYCERRDAKHDQARELQPGTGPAHP